MKTASELALAIARIDNLGEADVASLTRRIRHLEASGLIDAAPEPRDGRGTAQFDTEQCARARLLSILMDFGLDRRQIERANEELLSLPYFAKYPESARLEGGGYNASATGLRCIVRGTKAGEDWFLRVRVTRRPDGLREVHVSVLHGGDMQEQTPQLRRVLGAMDATRGETILGTLEVRASDLIRPLLTEMGA